MTLKRSAGMGVGIAILLVALVSMPAIAQGRGGRRGGRDADQPSQREDDRGKDWSNLFEDMASTKPVMKDVKIDKSAKDSIDRIEKTYKENFRGYANAAKRVFDDAKGRTEPPSAGQLDTLVQYAHDLQDREYAEIRQLLPEDQRARFDANIAKRRTDEGEKIDEKRHNLGRSP
jgi:hypothetical protein